MSPGHREPLLLVDSTPVECARSRETVKRGGNHSLPDALTDAADYGYGASRAFEDSVIDLGAQILRPRHQHEAGQDRHLAPIRQRIESIFWTRKDILALERHGARTLHALRTRIACRFLALAAAVALDHQLGRPTRAIADLTA